MKKKQNLTTKGSIVINSKAESIWDVLTNPDKIKQYLFGSEAITDWKVGHPVIFQRNSGGKIYRDKGEILDVVPNKLLKFSYWSSQEGYDDIPENYSLITYTLETDKDNTIKLTYLREKIPIEFEQKNQERYLPGMLENIKKIAKEK